MCRSDLPRLAPHNQSPVAAFHLFSFLPHLVHFYHHCHARALGDRSSRFVQPARTHQSIQSFLRRTAQPLLLPQVTATTASRFSAPPLGAYIGPSSSSYSSSRCCHGRGFTAQRQHGFKQSSQISTPTERLQCSQFTDALNRIQPQSAILESIQDRGHGQYCHSQRACHGDISKSQSQWHKCLRWRR